MSGLDKTRDQRSIGIYGNSSSVSEGPNMQGIHWRGIWDESYQSLFTNVCSVVSLGLCLHGSIIVKVTAWESFEGCRNPIGGPERWKCPRKRDQSHEDESCILVNCAHDVAPLLVSLELLQIPEHFSDSEEVMRIALFDLFGHSLQRLRSRGGRSTPSF